jgi:hypothetical protein
VKTSSHSILASAAPRAPRRAFLQTSAIGALSLANLPLLAAARPVPDEPLEIGHTPQFFVDDFIVDNRWSLKPKREEVLRVFHPPKKHELNPLVRGDGGYVSVKRDAQGGGFKMWYQTHQAVAGGEEGNEYAIAYAESADGLQWKLPKLGLHAWKGTRDNNIVWKGKGSKRASGPQILEVSERDRRGYRFILTYRTGGVRDASGVRVVGSQDGIHWDEANDSLIAALPSDTQNSIVFDETAGEYVMFCRPKDRYLVGGRTDALLDGESRRIARMSGKSLWEKWSGAPETILIPDELDMQRGFNRFYGMSAKYHAGIHWGFVWPFKLNTDIVTELAWSRDGWNWQRFPTRPRLLELGAEGAWDDGMVFGSADWVEMGDQWWLYYAGSDGPHEARERTAGIGVAVLRKEGFISLHGPLGGGVVCTKRLRWPGGSLWVNADARAGEMKVRVSDERRKAIAGFDFSDCQPFTGDSVAQEIVWKGKSLNALKGQVVRLEFFLRDADLYTFCASTNQTP